MKRILAINPPVLCVNACQKEWYSFAHPTSLLKIVAYQKTLGIQIELIDCMAYENEWHAPLVFYKKLPLGTRDLGLTIDAYILGKDFDWLETELAGRLAPDEIWVSCHLTFNASLTHRTISVARKVFDGVPVLVGGNYPTLFPEDAGKSGASVFRGRLADAQTCFPDYSVFETPPEYAVFQLTLGCRNACTHCANHLLGPVVKLDRDALVNDLAGKVQKFGIRTFVNIDPNIAFDDLMYFLESVIERKLDIELYFFGGISPDIVTPQLAALMKRANVKGISLPRELNRPLNARLGKKYAAGDFHHAVRLFEKEKFDLTAFHCPFPVALRDDDIAQLFAIIREIRAMGAVAEIAPISFIPGTLEYERHADLLAGKNLEALNWALWPTLDSIEKLKAYATLYNLSHRNRFNDPWGLFYPDEANAEGAAE